MNVTLRFEFTGADDPFAEMAIRAMMDELAINDVLSGAVDTALEHAIEDEGKLALEDAEVDHIEVLPA